MVESVDWMVPTRNRAETLREKIGQVPNIHFHPFFGSWNSQQIPISGKRFAGILKAFIKRLPFLSHRAFIAHRRNIDRCIESAASSLHSTHCWFHFVQGQTVPQLAIPISGLVHDQNFRHFPENFPKGKVGQFRGALESWLERSQMVSVLSEEGRQEINGVVPQPRARIEVIPNAVSPSFPPKPRKGSTEPCFLYPAAALSHKNHLLIFQAAKLLEGKNVEYKFVICGKGTGQFGLESPSSTNRGIEEARRCFQANKHIFGHRFDFRGECTLEELDALYSSSRAVVLPSKYEGFGLPLVEALARNTPVLCSRLVPFMEQVERYQAQEWVSFFDQGDPASLANLILKACYGYPENRENVFPVENFSVWTWGDVAQKYHEIFVALAGCPLTSSRAE